LSIGQVSFKIYLPSKKIYSGLSLGFKVWGTVNPLLNPPWEGLFISNTCEGGLIEMGGLFERGDVFNLAKMMISVLLKNCRTRRVTGQVHEAGGSAGEDQKINRTSST